MPEGATMPNDPTGMTRLANGIITWKKGGAAFDYFFRGVKPGTRIKSGTRRISS